MRRYNKTEKGKEAQRRRRMRDLTKIKAQRVVNNSIRDGKLIRQSCEICGQPAEAHHADYSQPLMLRWLCHKHHVKVHYPHTSLV